jgi:hypothetical protein
MWEGAVRKAKTVTKGQVRLTGIVNERGRGGGAENRRIMTN